VYVCVCVCVCVCKMILKVTIYQSPLVAALLGMCKIIQTETLEYTNDFWLFGCLFLFVLGVSF
jgi:Sec-independent protein secretion pathway component TatC